MKTFISYSGNKSQHINKFKHLIPDFKGTYIEPFLGSGALFLHLQPKKWIINDLNKDLINAWSQVKDNSVEIIKLFKVFETKFKPLNKENKNKMCQELTQQIEPLSYNVNRASLFLLMKFCSFMGNIMLNGRFYFKGVQNFIIYKNYYPFLNEKYYNNLRKVSNHLNTNGKIYNKDYSLVLKNAKKGDFVFLDPPYLETHNYQFNYNKEEKLDNKFLSNLLSEVKKLDKRGVKWMMTQADTKEIKETFKDYKIEKYSVYRAGLKKHVNELVIMNY